MRQMVPRSASQAEAPRQRNTKYHCEATYPVLQRNPLAGKLLERNDQPTDSLRWQGLQIHALVELGARNISQPPNIVAVFYVCRKRLQQLARLSAVDADERRRTTGSRSDPVIRKNQNVPRSGRIAFPA
jgi:hypothetical protein